MKERLKNKNTTLQELKVAEQSELLAFLIAKNIRKSRNAIKSLLIHKQIQVNGKVVTQHNHALKAGDTITVHTHNTKLNQKKLKGLTIIYEDKDLIVIDKEAGLLPISTGNGAVKETAYNIVNHYIKEKNAKKQVYVMYRLDRETSGLMVFAKSEDIQEELQQEWSLRPPKRSYQAIVEGKMDKENGTITSWLTENKNFLMFATNFDNGGLKSVINYTALAASNKYSLLRIDPQTFRKNQIRVQLQSIGHSILGDKKYGSKINPLKRIALHADKLEFFHPATHEIVEIIAPLPKKMQVLADALLQKPEAGE